MRWAQPGSWCHHYVHSFDVISGVRIMSKLNMRIGVGRLVIGTLLICCALVPYHVACVVAIKGLQPLQTLQKDATHKSLSKSSSFHTPPVLLGNIGYRTVCNTIDVLPRSVLSIKCVLRKGSLHLSFVVLLCICPGSAWTLTCSEMAMPWCGRHDNHTTQHAHTATRTRLQLHRQETVVSLAWWSEILAQ